jgi:hypothetical protein
MSRASTQFIPPGLLHLIQRFFSQHTAFRNRRFFDVLWLAGLWVYILGGTPLVPFHGDESTQIFMSRDYAYQFIERDLSKIYYSDNPTSPTEQHLRLLNGTVNKYLIGLAWHLNGFTVNDVNEQWDWGADWNYNQQNNHAPSSALLMTARWPSAILLATGAAVIFIIGQIIGGRWTAYLTSLYYALNPALLLNGRRAMMEGSFILFSLLVVLAGLWWLQKPSWRRGILLGIVSGLALASKHTALFTLIPVFSVCGGFIIQSIIVTWRGKSPAPYWRKFIGLIVAMGLTALTFLALNPAWWDNPAARAGKVLALRQDLLTIQTNVFGSYPNVGEQLAGFLRQTLVVLPQYYEVSGWEKNIGDQMVRYQSSFWHGVSIGGSVVGAVVFGSAILIGVSALFRRRRERLIWMVGIWALAVTGATLLLTPLEWQRYYLPTYPALGLLAAFGISQLIERIRGQST